MSLMIWIEMMVLHFIADYFLQGILADLKCKSWWMSKSTNEQQFVRYANDYKSALVAHSFEWAFIVMLPMFHQAYKREFVWMLVMMYVFLFIINIVAHYKIDDLKANIRKINLGEDQLLHFIQIFVTWFLWTAVMGWYI